MDSPRLILFLMLYVIVVSTSVGLFAVGMGLTGYDVNSSVTSPVNFTAPTDAGLLNSNFAAALVQTILGVLFWNVSDAILPMWANIVFVKIPLVCLIASIVEVLLP